MKTKHLFMTFGVALAMGMATMSSCAVREAISVDAATSETTIYVDMSGATWGIGNINEFRVYLFGGSDPAETYIWWEGSSDNKGHLESVVINEKTYATFTMTGRDYTGGVLYAWNMNGQGNQTDDFTFAAASEGNNLLTITKRAADWEAKNEVTWGTLTIPSTKHTVTTHVTQADGTTVVDDSQEVLDGGAPVNPVVNTFGYGFSGWYSDAQMTTPLPAVTADTVAYGAIVERAKTTHTVDVSLVSTTFSTVYAYFYDKTAGVDKAAWPGEDVTSTKTITVPDNTTIVINNGNGKQTWDIANTEGSKAYLRVLNETYEETGNYKTEWAEAAVDVPATTGYYVMSSENAWNFATAVKMSTEDLDVGNCAEYFGYSGKEGEKIYVRGWTKDTEEDNPHNSYGHFNGDDIEGVGHKDENGNFVFDADKEIDIFAKWDESEFHFYVREAVESFDITVYHVKFTGATKTEKEATPYVARATEGIDFEYEFVKENYVLVGLYTDEACTVAAPKQFTEATTVYAKFVRSAGIYVFHDPDWNLETAFYLDIENKTNPDNYCEGTVVVPNTASEETPYKMKPFTFDGEAHAYDNYGLGMKYSYASLDSEHNDIKFIKGGTYAVYVQVGEGGHATVWLNEGLAAFNTKFHNEVNAVCDAVTGNTDLDELKAVWLGLEVAYNELSEADQKALKAHEDADSAATYSAYEYIIHKYGTAELNDFIFNRNIEPSAQFVPTSISSETVPVMIIVIASVMLLSVATVTTVIVLKKTRFHK